MENKFTRHFQECISQWLEKEKANDETFASRVNKSKKTVKGCCNYILAAVKESQKTGFTDEEVYGMARHFFDEDDIKDPGDQGVARIVFPEHTDLSASQIAECKRKAQERYEKELRDEAKKKAEEEEKARKERLDALREKKKKECEGDLFGF